MSRLSPSAAVAAVVAEVRGRPGTVWVGVDGMGAAGKTTLADRIVAALPGSALVHVDDFARPDVRGWERDRFVTQVVEPLMAGEPARYRRWDVEANSGADCVEIEANSGADCVEIEPGCVVVVEGVSATDVRLGVLWDVVVWVDAPREVRLRRARERDGEAMMDRWLTDWIPSEEAYVAEQAPESRAQIIVDGTL